MRAVSGEQSCALARARGFLDRIPCVRVYKSPPSLRAVTGQEIALACAGEAAVFERVGWDAMADSNKRSGAILESLEGGSIIIDCITFVMGRLDMAELAATTPLCAAYACATWKSLSGETSYTKAALSRHSQQKTVNTRSTGDAPHLTQPYVRVCAFSWI